MSEAIQAHETQVVSPPPPPLCHVPDEIWINILLYIDSLRDKASLSLTQRCVYQIFSHPFIWDPLLKKHFPNSFSEPSNLKGISLYKQCTRIERNIKNSQYKFETISIGTLFTTTQRHRDAYIEGRNLFILDSRARPKFDENLPASKIPCMVSTYQLDTGVLLKHNFVMIESDPNRGNPSLPHDNRPCMCVEGDNLFISGHHVVDASGKQVVNVVNRKNNTVMQTFHTDREDFHIVSLCVNDNFVYAGGNFNNRGRHKGIIMIWDRNHTDAKPRTLQDVEFYPVLAMKVCKDRLFAQVRCSFEIWETTYANRMEVWDLNDFKMIKNFEFKKLTISSSFEVHDNFLFIHHCAKNPSIYSFDLNDKEAKFKKIYRAEAEQFVRIQMYCGSLFMLPKYSNKINVLNFNPPSMEMKKNDTALLLIPQMIQESVLGISFYPLPHLQPLQVTVENPGGSRELQKAAFEKKENVVACLRVLKSKVDERLFRSTPDDDEKGGPWAVTLKKIYAANTDLQDRSTTARSLINTFEQESYSQLVVQINILIDEFNALETTHQVSLLKEYAFSL